MSVHKTVTHALALRLSEGTAEGEQEFALPGDGAEIFLLEEQPYFYYRGRRSKTANTSQEELANVVICFLRRIT